MSALPSAPVVYEVALAARAVGVGLAGNAARYAFVEGGAAGREVAYLLRLAAVIVPAAGARLLPAGVRPEVAGLPASALAVILAVAGLGYA